MTETERLAEATALLGRIVKCAREDRATTPGVTRLARALAEAERLLSRAPALPAAPEPSADSGIEYETLQEELETEVQRAGELASSNFALRGELLSERARAESAEAQLAAVREIIARKHIFSELADAFVAIEDLLTGVWRERALDLLNPLTPAPSTGAVIEDEVCPRCGPMPHLDGCKRGPGAGEKP